MPLTPTHTDREIPRLTITPTDSNRLLMRYLKGNYTPLNISLQSILHFLPLTATT
jgi:hypothetical protein